MKGDSSSPDSTAGPGAGNVDEQNPWPGLDSFGEKDSAYFFGRTREVAQLQRLLPRQRLSVVFGRSGLGKTSLLRAGLFPGLPESRIFPVYIRLDYNDTSTAPATQVRRTIAKEASERGIEIPEIREGETLWELFHREDAVFWNENNRPVTPLLVFDQFEELFTLGMGEELAVQTRAFLDELADLVEGRAPKAVRERLELNPAEARKYTFREHHYKVLISMREEWLADLEAIRERMPSIAHNRLRLHPMRGEAALEVVAHARNLVDEDVARKIVHSIAVKPDLPLPELEVEPALLSLMCSELNVKRQELGHERITEELLEEEAEVILVNFYERSMRGISAEVRIYVEDHLLTRKGYRDSVALENALEAPGVTADAIKQLVNGRFLRREDRDGTPRIELMHDRLTKVVRESRDRRHEVEEREKERKRRDQAEAERLRKEREERDARERVQRKKQVIALSILSVVAVLATIFALMQMSDAIAAKAEAETNFEDANDARARAETQTNLAEVAKAEAEINLRIANDAKAEAVMNLWIANAATLTAFAETDRANSATLEAERHLQDANTARDLAKTESDRANEEEGRARLAVAELAKRAGPLLAARLLDESAVWPRGRVRMDALALHDKWVTEVTEMLEGMPGYKKEKESLATSDGRVAASQRDLLGKILEFEEDLQVALEAAAPRREIIEVTFGNWAEWGIDPQDGLVPLWEDSGKQVFWHTASGAGPELAKDGTLVRDPVDGSRAEDGLRLVYLPGDKFDMGEAENDIEVPVSEFFISKYEITRAQWARLTRQKAPDDPTLPKASISWDDCEQELPTWNLQLPTEAEWEFACRAGNGGPYSFAGDESELAKYAWFRSDSAASPCSPVGQKLPNPWGLYDVHGNVFEWCWDEFASDSTRRVARGGSFDFSAKYARSAYRTDNFPASSSKNNVGVRPAWIIRD